MLKVYLKNKNTKYPKLVPLSPMYRILVQNRFTCQKVPIPRNGAHKTKVTDGILQTVTHRRTTKDSLSLGAKRLMIMIYSLSNLLNPA